MQRQTIELLKALRAYDKAAFEYDTDIEAYERYHTAGDVIDYLENQIMRGFLDRAAEVMPECMSLGGYIDNYALLSELKLRLKGEDISELREHLKWLEHKAYRPKSDYAILIDGLIMARAERRLIMELERGSKEYSLLCDVYKVINQEKVKRESCGEEVKLLEECENILGYYIPSSHKPHNTR